MTALEALQHIVTLAELYSAETHSIKIKGLIEWGYQQNLLSKEEVKAFNQVLKESKMPNKDKTGHLKRSLRDAVIIDPNQPLNRLQRFALKKAKGKKQDNGKGK